MPSRITEYAAASEKAQIVIDYCARNQVVPRKSDDNKLPEPWRGVSSGDIKEGIEADFGIEVSNGVGTWTWQRLGADHDVDAAYSFLRDRREELLDAGLKELATWRY